MLDDLTAQASPTLRDAYGIGADSAAELLIVFGDNPERIRSEAAFAKLCGTCPIPASSGQTSRHRLYRGGHRQANAALYRIAITRMRFHQPTIDYVARRTAEGLTKKDIIRCLKRFLAARFTNESWPTTESGNALPPPLEPIFDYRGVNALMESFCARMQVELLDRQRWRTRIELANAIFEYLEIFHNRQRRHTALKMRTPIEYERIHHDNNLTVAPLIQVS